MTRSNILIHIPLHYSTGVDSRMPHVLGLDRLLYKLDTSVDALENFSSTLLGVAEETIPKTSKKPQRHSVPWFNDSCQVAVAERNITYRYSLKIPPTRTYQTHVSSERKLGEPFDKTNGTVGDPMSLNSIVKPQ